MPYVDATAVPLQQMLDALNGSGDTTVSFDDFKTASIELLNQCRPYIT